MQSYIKEDSKIRNGIFLGQIAAIEFQGPYEYNKVCCAFSFLQLHDEMNLGSATNSSDSLLDAEQAFLRLQPHQTQAWPQVV